MNIVRSAGTIRKLEPGFYAVMECSTAEADQSAVAPLMRNKGGTPLLNREEGKSKSVKLKLTESKHNMRHRHEFPHRRQMIFLSVKLLIRRHCCSGEVYFLPTMKVCDFASIFI
ncbi:hypothetical protein MUK42_17305 [Musa troglodytarum]|uniref:Uncharacterized protein n=1 Tax=Musa troglodytarum TaxID=320322 RepID=A0A9E7EIB7_9LILI|nr:hypothetical protein MUK42_17305 [Musa troglodytarum]